MGNHEVNQAANLGIVALGGTSMIFNGLWVTAQASEGTNEWDMAEWMLTLAFIAVVIGLIGFGRRLGRRDEARM